MSFCQVFVYQQSFYIVNVVACSIINFEDFLHISNIRFIFTDCNIDKTSFYFIQQKLRRKLSQLILSFPRFETST